MRKQSLRMGKLPAECGFLLREFVLILSTLFAAVAFEFFGEEFHAVHADRRGGRIGMGRTDREGHRMSHYVGINPTSNTGPVGPVKGDPR